MRSRGDSRIPSSISVATRISKGIITRIINKRGDITDVSLAISIYSQESRGGGRWVRLTRSNDESKLARMKFGILPISHLEFKCTTCSIASFVLSIDNYRNGSSVAQSAPQCRCRGAEDCYLYNPGKTCPFKNKSSLRCWKK